MRFVVGLFFVPLLSGCALFSGASRVVDAQYAVNEGRWDECPSLIEKIEDDGAYYQREKELLRAKCLLGRGETEAGKKALQQVATRYPEEEEGIEAARRLKFLGATSTGQAEIVLPELKLTLSLDDATTTWKQEKQGNAKSQELTLLKRQKPSSPELKVGFIMMKFPTCGEAEKKAPFPVVFSDGAPWLAPKASWWQTVWGQAENGKSVVAACLVPNAEGGRPPLLVMIEYGGVSLNEKDFTVSVEPLLKAVAAAQATPSVEPRPPGRAPADNAEE